MDFEVDLRGWIRLIPVLVFWIWGLSIPSTRMFVGVGGASLIAAVVAFVPIGGESALAFELGSTCLIRETLWALVIGLQLLVPIVAYRFAGMLLDAGFQEPRETLKGRGVSRLYGVLFIAVLVSLDGHLVVFESAVLWASEPRISCSTQGTSSWTQLWEALSIVGDGLRVGAMLGGFVLVPTLFLHVLLASMERLSPWIWTVVEARSAMRWGIWGCVLLSLAILFEKVPDLVLEALEGADALVESRSP